MAVAWFLQIIERRKIMNKWEGIGRLARDPELSYTPNTNTAVASATIAIDRPKRNGESQGADFIRIKVFGKVAENFAKWKKKGDQIAVVGRIQTGSYKNKDGQTVYTTEVVADEIEFLGGGRNSGAASGGGNPSNAPKQQTILDVPGASDDDFVDDFGDFGDFEGFDA